MKAGIIGAGRMGKRLAQRLSGRHEVFLYDADPAAAQAAAQALGLRAASDLAEEAADALVLVVPDMAVKPCIEMLLAQQATAMVFNVATNISREMLAEMAGASLRALNVKLIGHAGEMGCGAQPVIVVDEADPALAAVAAELFAPVGSVVLANADVVQTINVIATEQALKAAVMLEQALRTAGIENWEMIHGALSVVAPGVIKAYAEDDLGPFARRIIAALREEGLP
jgi:pyrroline-5-carboxylate reductase